jgi:hypothetical protein
MEQKGNKRGRKPKSVVQETTNTVGKVKGCESCKAKNSYKDKVMFPHLYKEVRDLTEDEVLLMKRINSSKKIVNDDVNGLFTLYNDIFGTKVVRCNCPGLIMTFIERINDRYEF